MYNRFDAPGASTGMGWESALQETPDGVRILVEVSPGARQDQFPAGFNPWRGRIGVRVRAPAQDGRANKAVLALVAAALDVPAAQVVLAAGASDTRKTVAVYSMVRARVIQQLQPLMAREPGT